MNFASLDGVATSPPRALALVASWTDRLPAWTLSPLVWAVLLGAVALLCLLPRSGRRSRRAGIALGCYAVLHSAFSIRHSSFRSSRPDRNRNEECRTKNAECRRTAKKGHSACDALPP